MDKGIIEKIIEAANHAPSGGNSQPWKFVVEHDTVRIIMLPEKEHPVLNFRNRGTYVAHGALLENIDVAAQSFGYEAVFNFFPEPHVSAAVTFRPFARGGDNTDLHDILFKRHSNRKPYKTGPLSEDTKKFILREADKFPQCRLSIVEEGESIRSVAESTALDIRINLENKRLHELFFKEVLWNEEDQHQQPGLYIRTMEAAPPKSSVMQLLRHWKVAQLFNKIKLVQKIYEENAKTLASSSLCGAVIVPDDDDSFMHAGRLIENIWLRATKSGLSFQLIAGLVFLWQQAHFGERHLFSDTELNEISEAYKRLQNVFGVKDGEVIATTFRIGEAPPPMAVSYTRPPDITFED